MKEYTVNGLEFHAAKVNPFVSLDTAILDFKDMYGSGILEEPRFRFNEFGTELVVYILNKDLPGDWFKSLPGEEVAQAEYYVSPRNVKGRLCLPILDLDDCPDAYPIEDAEGFEVISWAEVVRYHPSILQGEKI